ncbi:MAG: helix-turn-helix domain-containing protein [Bauldia sp.]
MTIQAGPETFLVTPPVKARPMPAAIAAIGEPRNPAAPDVGGVRMNFARNAEIYGEGEPAEFVYRVVTGAIRTSKLLSDGRRQIGAFHTPGELFGLEVGDSHRFAAEAVVDSVVMVIRRSALLGLAARDPETARQLWAATAQSLDRAHEHMLLLGRKSAVEKLAAFLLEMSARGEEGEIVELPMSRYDIADYLGLTIETVSRTLTQLEKSAAIELPSSRRIVLRDASALRRLNA